tara:strand:+ start:272 stop:451 length:180 start_codon:yes stop_codon:yes gene_type:complete
MKTFTKSEIKELNIFDTKKKIAKHEADLELMKQHQIEGVELKEMEIAICKNTLTFLNNL